MNIYNNNCTEYFDIVDLVYKELLNKNPNIFKASPEATIWFVNYILDTSTYEINELSDNEK